MSQRLAILILAAFGLHAQDSRATIAGRVADPQQNLIPGATVVITNVETGVATKLTSNERGTYAAPLLIPGADQIAAEHTGFKKFLRKGVTL